MKRYIFFIICAFVFASCTNSEEVDIQYRATVSVAVDELMTPFKERNEGDFDILDGMSVRIQSFIYDSNGDLVKSCISSVSDYSQVVSYSAVLDEGNYKVVSIADFIAGSSDNPSTTFWNVTGINNIRSLKVLYGQYIGTWAYDTLGAIIEEFEVYDEEVDVMVSVPPVTALFQVIFDYSNIVEGDGTGVSIFAPFCSEIKICSETQYDVISGFDDLSFDFSSTASQKQTYNIMSDSPMETVDQNYLRNVGYRALLPQESKKFYWNINLIWPDGTTDSATSDYTPEIFVESGKQYELYLVLDALELYVNEVEGTRSVGHEVSMSHDSFGENMRNKIDLFDSRSFKVIDIAQSELYRK